MLEPTKLKVLRSENIPEPVDTILFLGAGASQPFGYPTSIELVDRLNPDEHERKWVISFVTIDELLRHCQKLVSGGKESLQMLQTIIQTQVGEINPMLPEEKRNQILEKVNSIKERYNEGLDIAESLGKKVIEAIFRVYSYREIAENYLDEYIQVLRKKNGDHLPIFTTNYDPAVESLELRGYKVNTLFAHVRHGLYQWMGQEAFVGNKKKKDMIHLFKLHGSTYWYKKEGKLLEERTYRPLSRQEEEIIPPGTVVGDRRVIEPYITYWDYFDVYLTQAKRAIFLGYRFDDREILGLLKEKTLEKIIMVNPEEVNVDLENVVKIIKPAQDAVKEVEEKLREPPAHNLE